MSWTRRCKTVRATWRRNVVAMSEIRGSLGKASVFFRKNVENDELSQLISGKLTVKHHFFQISGQL
jgi:hypothetical protein